MPIVLRYSLAMTVADFVFMVIQVWGGQHGLVGRLVIIASIVLVGVVLSVLAERDTTPRANAFQSGLTVTLTYLALDSLARTAFGVFLFGVPPAWRALSIPLAANALVILVVGLLTSTVVAAMLTWRGPGPVGGSSAAESRRRFGPALPAVVVVGLSSLVRTLESEKGTSQASAGMRSTFPTAMLITLTTFVIVVVSAAAVVGHQRRRVGGAYRQYCRAKGFGYAASPGDANVKHLAEDAPAVLGAPADGRRVIHTITGQWGGHPFVAIHYAFHWADYERRSDTRPRGVMLWEVPGRTFPHFVLTPEGFWHRLAETFGVQDIDFDEDPDFSRAYGLRGAEESAVRALFTPDVRHFLTVHPGQRVAGAGRCLAWWVDGGLPKPEAFDAFLERGNAVRRAFGA